MTSIFRNKIIVKIFCVFTLLIFLNVCFFPSVAFALSDNQFQREFNSYENGATDLVNLSTGNLAYTLPILSIPSPEGGFPITLSYHSGISPEEDASWVGLGWNINVGSVNRSVSMFPDDFRGEKSITSMRDPGYSGSSWNFLLVKLGWDTRSEVGNYGLVNLGIMSFGWGSQLGFEALGISVKESGVTGDAVSVGLSMVSLALNVAFPGTGGVLVSLAKDAIISMTTAMIAEMISISIAPAGKSGNMNHWTIKNSTRQGGVKKEYSVKLNTDITEELYGSMYLGDLPTRPFSFEGAYVSTGNQYTAPSMSLYPGMFDENTVDLFDDHHTNHDPAMFALAALQSSYYSQYPWLYDPKSERKRPASDMQMSSYGSSVYDNVAPSHITYDNFRVNGPGISGNIKPYRLDIGSLAISTTVGDVQRYNLIPFDPSEDYTVQFEYVGDLSNYYSYHVSKDFGNNSYNLNNSSYGMAYSNFGFVYGNNLNDPHKLGPRINVEYDKLFEANERQEEERDGLKSGYLAGMRHVKWKSNLETGNEIAGEHCIGGYEITNGDGTVYIYDIPVHNLTEKSYNGNLAETVKGQRSITDPYGIHWLLTEIHYSDYFDNNSDSKANEGDFGGWVRFEYAKFTDNYEYRFPYTNNKKMYAPSGESDALNYSSGARESYYLESIHTRTHTAIFVKDIRLDGRSYYDATDNNDVPTSSLMLKEIVLLSNENYDIITSGSSPYTGAALSKDNGNANSPPPEIYGQLINNEYIDDVWDIEDIEYDNDIRDFLDENQVQKIVFNYKDYVKSSVSDCLCNKTLNSFEIDGGEPPRNENIYVDKLCKLTLESISTYVQNNKKFMPDYDFIYSSNNPDYHEDQWDKWGMYYPDGEHNEWSHDFLKTSSTEYHDNWHLKTIISPTGSKINFEYERDSYSSVGGKEVIKNLEVSGYQINGGSTTFTYSIQTNEDLSEVIKIGDRVKVMMIFSDFNPNYETEAIELDGLIASVNTSSSQIVINKTPTNTFQTFVGAYLHHYPKELDGGDVRVSKVKVSNELGEEIVTKYKYNFFGSNTSSGVISNEPIWSKNHEYEFENQFDYPSTGVMYKNVTVYTNYENDNSYEMRKQFEFETINESMLIENAETISSGNYPQKITSTGIFSSGGNIHKNWQYNLTNFNIANDMARLGRVNKIEEYNSKDHLINSTEYIYHNKESYLKENEDLEHVDQGTYAEKDLYSEKFPGLRTEGSFVSHQTQGPTSHTGSEYWRFHFHRTTKVNYPNVLEETKIMKNGYRYTLRNIAYDYNTGIVLKQEYVNSLGYKYQTEVVPAYKVGIYSAMGSKVDDPDNKNILSAAALNSLSEFSNNKWNLLSSVATTWKEDWGNNNDAWRQHGQYVWKNQINKDGTYKNSGAGVAYTPLSFASPNNSSGWEVIFENTKYNDFSFVLESRTAGENHYTATRKDNRDENIIASALNSRYGEFTHSGAESSINSSSLYDGDVQLLNSASRISEFTSGSSVIAPHTGSFMYKVPSGGKIAVSLDVGSNTNPIQSDAIYTLVFWQNDLNYCQGALPCSITLPIINVTYTSGEWDTDAIDPQTITTNLISTDLNGSSNTSCQDQRFGDWHLISLNEILASSATNSLLTNIYLEISNPGNDPIYIDDIRFQPIDAQVKAAVINSETNLTDAILDNDNIATKYEYFTDQDFKVRKLKSVYREVRDRNLGSGDGGFKIVTSKDYNILDH